MMNRNYRNLKATNSKIKTKRLHLHGTASVVAAPVKRGGSDVPEDPPVLVVPSTPRLVVTLLVLEAIASPPPPPASLPLPLVPVEMTCTEVAVPEVEAPVLAVPEVTDLEVGVVTPEVWLDDWLEEPLLWPAVVLAVFVEVGLLVVELGLVVVELTVWPAAEVVRVPWLAQ